MRREAKIEDWKRSLIVYNCHHRVRERDIARHGDVRNRGSNIIAIRYWWEWRELDLNCGLRRKSKKLERAEAGWACRGGIRERREFQPKKSCGAVNKGSVRGQKVDAKDEVMRAIFEYSKQN